MKKVRGYFALFPLVALNGFASTLPPTTRLDTQIVCIQKNLKKNKVNSFTIYLDRSAPTGVSGMGLQVSQGNSKVPPVLSGKAESFQISESRENETCRDMWGAEIELKSGVTKMNSRFQSLRPSPMALQNFHMVS